MVRESAVHSAFPNTFPKVFQNTKYLWNPILDQDIIIWKLFLLCNVKKEKKTLS